MTGQSQWVETIVVFVTSLLDIGSSSQECKNCLMDQSLNMVAEALAVSTGFVPVEVHCLHLLVRMQIRLDVGVLLLKTPQCNTANKCGKQVK